MLYYDKSVKDDFGNFYVESLCSLDGIEELMDRRVEDWQRSLQCEINSGKPLSAEAIGSYLYADQIIKKQTALNF